MPTLILIELLILKFDTLLLLTLIIIIVVVSAYLSVPPSAYKSTVFMGIRQPLAGLLILKTSL